MLIIWKSDLTKQSIIKIRAFSPSFAILILINFEIATSSACLSWRYPPYFSFLFRFSALSSSKLVRRTRDCSENEFIAILVPWNAACATNEQCDGGNTMMICRNGRCACNQPWFRACNYTCGRTMLVVFWIERNVLDDSMLVVNPGVSYDKDRCIVQANCINYTNCVDNRCQCFADYTSVNGVCCSYRISSVQIAENLFSVL